MYFYNFLLNNFTFIYLISMFINQPFCHSYLSLSTHFSRHSSFILYYWNLSGTRINWHIFFYLPPKKSNFSSTLKWCFRSHQGQELARWMFQVCHLWHQLEKPRLLQFQQQVVLWHPCQIGCHEQPTSRHWRLCSCTNQAVSSNKIVKNKKMRKMHKIYMYRKMGDFYPSE